MRSTTGLRPTMRPRPARVFPTPAGPGGRLGEAQARPCLVPPRTVSMRSDLPRSRAIAAALAALALGGCAGTGGPLSARRTTMGTLKADVARLESQNQQFRRQVAELETDKHRINEQ